MPTHQSPAVATPDLGALRAVLAQTPESESIVKRIEAFASDLVTAAGDNLASLAVFGGIARGRYRPERSDVNVLVVLERAGTPELRAIGPALQAAWRSIRVEPMILTASHVAATARVFPTKFLDIKESHVRLAGRDVLSALDVPRERIIWRVEQELRNMAIRLRRRLAVAGGDSVVMARDHDAAARPLAIELSWLLRMRGDAVPAEDRTAAIFRAAAGIPGVDVAALDELAALRQDPGPRPGLDELCGRVISTISAAADAAARTV